MISLIDLVGDTHWRKWNDIMQIYGIGNPKMSDSKGLSVQNEWAVV